MNELQLSEIIRNYGLIIGGLIGLYFAWNAYPLRRAKQMHQYNRRNSQGGIMWLNCSIGQSASLLMKSWRFGSVRSIHCVKSLEIFQTYRTLPMSF
jgi:hypothetical protein